jgi:hypothetical protein
MTGNSEAGTMAYHKNAEWARVLDLIDEAWPLLTNAANDLTAIPWPQKIGLLTHEFVAAIDATNSGIDPSPITELYGRLLGFYKRADSHAIKGTKAELQAALQRAYWVVNRCIAAGIVPEKSLVETVRRKRNRRPARTSISRLTEKQLEAHRLFGETNGNMSEVARRMGVKAATAKQHYDAANKKLGRMAGQLAKPKTQAIPRDRRGQEIIADDGE